MATEKKTWTEVEKDVWEKTYQSNTGDLLYIEDNLNGQTELGDEYWDEGRYSVRVRPGFGADEPSDLERTYDAFDDLGEAEAFLDGLVGDF